MRGFPLLHVTDKHYFSIFEVNKYVIRNIISIFVNYWVIFLFLCQIEKYEGKEKTPYRTPYKAPCKAPERLRQSVDLQNRHAVAI